MTSSNHHHHYHHPQHHQLARLHPLAGDMTSSLDVARWFSDDGYRCQSAHRHHGNIYSPPFFQHPMPRRQDGVVSAHSWPSNVVDGTAADPWSLHPAGSALWAATGTGRPGCRGLEPWPVADNCASPLSGTHRRHQQQYPQSPDDVTASPPIYKYPWMSIIGEFNSTKAVINLTIGSSLSFSYKLHGQMLPLRVSLSVCVSGC